MMCEVLEVSRSGYYDFAKGRAPGERQKRREELTVKIKEAYAAGRCTYGSPRICQELKAQGQEVCENTVAKLMRENDIRSIVAKRFKVNTTDSNHRHPIAANVLNRDFDQELPDQAWAADITYVPTDEGWLYLGVVIDLCSRRIVGWSMGSSLKAELCTAALEMAIGQRNPSAGLIHHSDRGCQYACGLYRDLLESQGIVCSMSNKGNCYDNAVAESFFKTLKAELVYHRHYATRQEAMASIFDYIEVFYNRQRLHSSLRYKSPAQYEASFN
jgi:transposase InsO family protein